VLVYRRRGPGTPEYAVAIVGHDSARELADKNNRQLISKGADTEKTITTIEMLLNKYQYLNDTFVRHISHEHRFDNVWR